MKLNFAEIDTSNLLRIGLEVASTAGQFFAPRRVNYIQSEALHDHAVILGGMRGPLAGLELFASTGAAALSAATLLEVRKLSQKLDQVERRLDNMQITLNDIHRIVRRVDTKVAETHLREALNHGLRKAVSHEGIELMSLLPLRGDITNLEETVDGSFLMNFSVQLSSDIRENLANLLEFLQCLRYTYVGTHNRTVGGDPDLSLEWNPTTDYFPVDYRTCAEIVPMFYDLLEVLNDYKAALLARVNSEFWVGTKEQANAFEAIFNDSLQTPLFSACFKTTALSASFDMWDLLNDLEVDIPNRETATQLGRQIFHHWHESSDSSLLFRLRRELDAVATSYQEVFYQNTPKEYVTKSICGTLIPVSSAN